jgi:hypothetical protein
MKTILVTDEIFTRLLIAVESRDAAIAVTLIHSLEIPPVPQVNELERMLAL